MPNCDPQKIDILEVYMAGGMLISGNACGAAMADRVRTSKNPVVHQSEARKQIVQAKDHDRDDGGDDIPNPVAITQKGQPPQPIVISKPDDRNYLLNFIALLSVKSPRDQENSRQVFEQIVTRMMTRATVTPERWASEIRRLKVEGVIPQDAPVMITSGHGSLSKMLATKLTW